MHDESGRSLIEIIGVLAIGAIMTAATIGAYNNIRGRQLRTIATEQLAQISKNTKLLLSSNGDYSPVSVSYLIKSGALKSDRAPIGGAIWSITPTFDNIGFSINITGLSKSDCDYFSLAKIDFAEKIIINEIEKGFGENCLKAGGNNISFISLE